MSLAYVSSPKMLLQVSVTNNRNEDTQLEKKSLKATCGAVVLENNDMMAHFFCWTGTMWKYAYDSR
jgi:hypothetical protein